MRAKRLEFYASLIGPGDLVFDVGANVGERAEVFLELGARVVAVEPQAECTAQLLARWRDEPRFTLFEGACADAEGEHELFVSTASTLSTMSPAWMDAVEASGMFAEHQWKEQRTVPTTTLDALVAIHGVPKFVKIDVEGYEYEVLKGLSGPVGCASIEWVGISRETTAQCIRHFSEIGMGELNISYGESMALESERWLSMDEILRVLEERVPADWGDIYARSAGAAY
jgi:FkbM family methyltransferase